METNDPIPTSNREEQAIALALLSALAYGASVPASKILLENATSLQLSALLYLGGGIGVGAILLWKAVVKRKLLRLHPESPQTQTTGQKEASLAQSEIPTIIVMLLVNTASIVCLMGGINCTLPANASLLSNFEVAATAILAHFIFGENLGRQMSGAAALICLASILLTWEGTGSFAFSSGSLLIMLACILWGLENCCTRSLSDKDPLQLTCVKGIGTGTLASAISIAFDGVASIETTVALAAIALGFVSYGLSIVLYIRAQRTLGAARTGNYYAIAPFAGVALSWAIFGFKAQPTFLASLALMVAGIWITASDCHKHDHVHHATTHDHQHTHDDGHHSHTHTEPDFNPSTPHSHQNQHSEIRHSHPHTPDIHHAHRHSARSSS